MSYIERRTDDRDDLQLSELKIIDPCTASISSVVEDDFDVLDNFYPLDCSENSHITPRVQCA